VGDRPFRRHPWIFNVHLGELVRLPDSAMAADLLELRRYQEATKHSPSAVRSSVHSLDWPKKPLAFKIYTGLDSIRPPEDVGL
jgi:hypothetical protein